MIICVSIGLTLDYPLPQQDKFLITVSYTSLMIELLLPTQWLTCWREIELIYWMNDCKIRCSVDIHDFNMAPRR